MNKEPFPDTMVEMANNMGISMYQRFSMNEACLFLRCSIDDLMKLTRAHKISFIQVTKDQIDFFGFQLLEHLVDNVVTKPTKQSSPDTWPERIVRAKELHELTGLSRTTIWRMERKGEFPSRVPLSGNSVGWRYSEVMEWMKLR
ncbi:MAG: AlpA family transcriptional regulator [Desulfobulbaceae bacterium]|jgi:predicted DNA-binding transcriptional regulator AlpA|nr:AlpA family transcriptional regulator [Desulfobulbaceae bacterium]